MAETALTPPALRVTVAGMMTDEERQRLERLFDPTLGRTRSVMQISPEGAAYLLRRLHKSQRKPSEVVVGGMVRVMADGKWTECREPGIMISAHEPSVANGQHRLLAQVRAGVTLNWIVVTGCTAQEIADIDNLVVPRTLLQQIRFLGKNHDTRTVGTMRAVYLLQHSESALALARRVYVGPDDFQRLMESHGDVYAVLRGLEGFGRLSTGVAGVITYAARRYESECVELSRACLATMRMEAPVADLRHGNKDPGIQLGYAVLRAKRERRVGGGVGDELASAAAYAIVRKVRGLRAGRLDAGVWTSGIRDLQALCGNPGAAAASVGEVASFEGEDDED